MLSRSVGFRKFPAFWLFCLKISDNFEFFGWIFCFFGGEPEFFQKKLDFSSGFSENFRNFGTFRLFFLKIAAVESRGSYISDNIIVKIG